MDYRIEKCVMLTPKGIYGVIKKALTNSFNRCKHITLVRFWQIILSPVLRESELTVLTTDGSQRSRSLSNILNRTGTSGRRSQLCSAFQARMDSKMFVELTSSFADFLNTMDCDTRLLSDVLTIFEDDCISYDNAINEEIAKQIVSVRNAKCMKNADETRWFMLLLAYRLAWLTAQAFAGSDMEHSAATKLYRAQECSIEIVYGIYFNAQFGRALPKILTSTECQLCDWSLPVEKYEPPCEDESIRIIDLLNKQGKVLVTGIKGSGKTETVRQLLSYLSKHSLYGAFAYVQYKASIKDSFRTAFPDLVTITDDCLVEAVIDRLSTRNYGKILLCIDDVYNVSDPDLAFLSHLQCDVIITSRSTELTGFVAYKVKSLTDIQACKLFESITMKIPFCNSDEMHVINNAVNGNPAVLILLAQTALYRTLRPAQLIEEISTYSWYGVTAYELGKMTTVGDEFGIAFCMDRVRDEMKSILAVFPLLNGRHVSIEQLAYYLTDSVPDMGLLVSIMRTCVQEGLLEIDANGFYMQPVIAYSVSKYLPIADHERLFSRLDSLFKSDLGTVPAALAASEIVSCLFTFENEKISKHSRHYELLIKAIYASLYIDDSLAAKLVSFLDESAVKNCFEACIEYSNDMSSECEKKINKALQTWPDCFDELEIKALALVGKVISSNPETAQKYIDLLNKISAVIKQPELMASVHFVIAQTALMILGDADNALKHLESGKEIINGLPEVNLDVQIEAKIAEGLFAVAVGDPEQGILVFEGALELYRQKGDTTSKQLMAPVYSYLSFFYSETGDYDKALECAKKLVDVPVSEFKADSVSKLSDLHGLALVYYRLGLYDEAFEANTVALYGANRLGEASLMELGAIWQLRGNIYYRQRKLRNALNASRRAVSIVSSVFGKEHIRTAETELFLARILDAVNRHEEANELRKSACLTLETAQKNGYLPSEEVVQMMIMKG